MTVFFVMAGIAFGGLAVLLTLAHKAHARTRKALSDVRSAIGSEESRDE